MADSDAIRELHRARLAAANQAFQQSVVTLTNSQRAFSRDNSAVQADHQRPKEANMKAIVLVALMSAVVGISAADSSAQTAGSVLVSTSEMRAVAQGWSAKKQILGKDVYNDAGEKIGDINDLIVTPDRSLSYAIVGVGGFLGVGEHNVAVPVSKFKQQMNKIVLPGVTKDALKAAPKFEYAK